MIFKLFILIYFIIDIDCEEQSFVGEAIYRHGVAHARSEYSSRFLVVADRYIKFGLMDIEFAAPQPDPAAAVAYELHPRVDDVVGADVAVFECEDAIAVLPQSRRDDEVARQVLGLAFHHGEAVVEMRVASAVVVTRDAVRAQLGAGEVEGDEHLVEVHVIERVHLYHIGFDVVVEHLEVGAVELTLVQDHRHVVPELGADEFHRDLAGAASLVGSTDRISNGRMLASMVIS